MTLPLGSATCVPDMPFIVVVPAVIVIHDHGKLGQSPPSPSSLVTSCCCCQVNYFTERQTDVAPKLAPRMKCFLTLNQEEAEAIVQHNAITASYVAAWGDQQFIAGCQLWKETTNILEVFNRAKQLLLPLKVVKLQLESKKALAGSAEDKAKHWWAVWKLSWSGVKLSFFDFYIRARVPGHSHTLLFRTPLVGVHTNQDKWFRGRKQMLEKVRKRLDRNMLSL